MARGVRSASTRHRHHALNGPAVNNGLERTIAAEGSPAWGVTTDCRESIVRFHQRHAGPRRFGAPEYAKVRCRRTTVRVYSSRLQNLPRDPLVQVVLQDTALLRKARGAFFTPSEITEFIAEWGIRGVCDRVLEPSCGEAAFLSAAGSTLLRAGQTDDLAKQLHGYEIHAASAITAKAILAENGIGATIGVGDFFETLPKQDSLFDVVIGNPPYVRYQNFAGASRTAALEAALRQGVRLTQLASSWAAFTVHATAFLKPGGRLGLVLPAELLSVKYAAQIRELSLIHI